jgi:hypothetical protein
MAATAHADGDPRDDAFLGALNEVGIGYPSADQVIASGKAVCGYIEGRHSFVETVQAVKDANPGLSLEQSMQFVDLARDVYCPLPLAGGGGGG